VEIHGGCVVLLFCVLWRFSGSFSWLFGVGGGGSRSGVLWWFLAAVLDPDLDPNLQRLVVSSFWCG